jgi:hypothetical protein
MRSHLKEKVAAAVQKTDISFRGGFRRADHATPPLSAKVGNKIRRQVAVAQSADFTCRLKATELGSAHTHIYIMGYST